jgi:hypothetical protein
VSTTVTPGEQRVIDNGALVAWSSTTSYTMGLVRAPLPTCFSALSGSVSESEVVGLVGGACTTGHPFPPLHPAKQPLELQSSPSEPIPSPPHCAIHLSTAVRVRVCHPSAWSGGSRVAIPVAPITEGDANCVQASQGGNLIGNAIRSYATGEGFVCRFTG